MMKLLDYKIFKIFYYLITGILGIILILKFPDFISQWDKGGLTAFRFRWGYLLGIIIELVLIYTLFKLHPFYNWIQQNKSNILVLLITITLGLTIIEIFLRMTDIGGLSHNIEIRKLYQIMQDDPILGFKHKPGLEITLGRVPIKINQNGLRNPNISLVKPEFTKRILVLGDSVVFGWGVKEEETFSRQLETLLNQDTSFPKIEVINSGVCAYNTLQEKEYLIQNGLRYKPDIVILLYVTNDPEDSIRSMHPKSWYIRFVNQVYLKHAMDQLLIRFMAHKELDSEFVKQGTGWQASKNAIIDINKTCNNNNIHFILVFYDMGHSLAEQNAYTLLVELGKLEGIPVLSTYDWFQSYTSKELVNSMSDSHPNPKAHKIMAGKLKNVLKSYIHN